MLKMDKSKGKTRFAWASLMLAIMLVVAGCGSGGDSGSKKENWISIEDRYTPDPETPAWKLDKKEEATELTWYVNADWWNTDFGKDVVTKKIKEDLNINIKFITGDDTKLNTFFAGGDMPDLITTFDSNSPVVQKAATWALPLNDLAEKYDPHFNKVAAQDTLNWFQLKDGKTYGYPNYSNTQADYDSGNIPAQYTQSQLTQLVFNNRLDAGLTIFFMVVVVVLGLFSIKTALAALKEDKPTSKETPYEPMPENVEEIVAQAKGAH